MPYLKLKITDNSLMCS